MCATRSRIASSRRVASNHRQRPEKMHHGHNRSLDPCSSPNIIITSAESMNVVQIGHPGCRLSSSASGSGRRTCERGTSAFLLPSRERSVLYYNKVLLRAFATPAALLHCVIIIITAHRRSHLMSWIYAI